MMENKVSITYSNGRIKASSSQGTTNSEAVTIMMIAAAETMLVGGMTTDEIMGAFKETLSEVAKARKDSADAKGN